MLARNTEKIRSIDFDIYRFQDSLDHLSGSLRKLVEQLASSGHNFPIIDEHLVFNKSSPTLKNMLISKGFYPYEYCDSLSKLKLEKTLPSHKFFFNTLTNSNISYQEYLHAQKCFSTFNCKNMVDYLLLYCTIDTLLLAECFMTYKKSMLSNYKLDPSQYYGIPSLAFDSALLNINTSLELLSSCDLVNFFRKGIRGGLSFINTRYALASNSNKKRKKHLFYLDANNLYGQACTYSLPYSDYQWLSKKEIANISISKILAYSNRDSHGSVLEVDLHFPPETHLKFNDFPLLPENIQLSFDDLSPYTKSLLEKNGIKNKIFTRLISHLGNREKYIIHISYLQFCIKQGIKLLKIHRGVSFIQKDFMKSHIKKIAKLRASSKTPFEQNLHKTIANAGSYGKFIENPLRHINTYVVKNEKELQNMLKKKFCKTFRVVNDSLCLAFAEPKIVTYNRPVSVGMVILDYAKQIMGEFWEKITTVYGLQNIELLCHDTDSFIFSVTSDVGYDETINKIERIMDFSKYPPDHPFFSLKNKNQLGFLKDELEHKNKISEFIGLRSKSYALKLISLDPKQNPISQSRKVCKGILKRTHEELSFNDYYNCLFREKTIRKTQKRISFKNHQLKNESLEKITLTAYDTKRYVHKCRIHTIPFGSKLIKKKICHKCR